MFLIASVEIVKRKCMSRYEPLRQFLEARAGDQVPMTFEEIEGVLRRGLPDSARRHQAWWANTTSHSHAGSWLAAGYRTEQLDIGGERVVFVRDRDGLLPGGGSDRRPPAGDALSISLDSLNGPALRMIDDYAEEWAVTRSEAIVALLNAAGTERRRGVLEEFRRQWTGKPGSDSTQLIREDRDGR